MCACACMCACMHPLAWKRLHKLDYRMYVTSPCKSESLLRIILIWFNVKSVLFGSLSSDFWMSCNNHSSFINFQIKIKMISLLTKSKSTLQACTIQLLCIREIKRWSHRDFNISMKVMINGNINFLLMQARSNVGGGGGHFLGNWLCLLVKMLG